MNSPMLQVKKNPPAEGCGIRGAERSKSVATRRQKSAEEMEEGRSAFSVAPAADA
jgi:hypothetical protein